MAYRASSLFTAPESDRGGHEAAVGLIVALVDAGAELRVISEGGAAHLVAPQPLLPELAAEIGNHLPQILDAFRGRPCDACLEEERRGRFVVACGRCGYSGVRT